MSAVTRMETPARDTSIPLGSRAYDTAGAGEGDCAMALKGASAMIASHKPTALNRAAFMRRIS